MNFSAENCGKIVNYVQAMEFLIEYLGKPSEKRLYGSFCILELGKLILKLKKWREGYKYNVYISETNQYAIQEEQEELEAMKFEKQFGNLTNDNVNLKEQLSNIKKQGKQGKFNLGFFEAIGEKSVSILTTLPIPEQFKREKSNRFNQVKLFCGELLFLIRPLVHCIMLYIFGNKSYKPFFLSMILDLLRILIEINLILFRKCQKEEMKLRIKEAIICYILRDPFYSTIVKQEIILKILGKLFKVDGWISKFIIQIIEIRSSKSLLL